MIRNIFLCKRTKLTNTGLTVFKQNNITQLSRYSSVSEIHKNSEKHEWKTIYHFPLIRFVSAANKLKIYPLTLAAVGTPFILGASIMGLDTGDLSGIWLGFGNYYSLNKIIICNVAITFF